MPTPKLYAVLLGGKHPEAILELHDIRFTFANDFTEIRKNLSRSWFGEASTAHVDAYQNLESIDGYRRCEKNEAETKKTLFFINIGGYLKNTFNEEHRYLFLIGDTLTQMKTRVKSDPRFGLRKPHFDNFEIVDNLIRITQVDGEKLYWKRDASAKDSAPIAGYWPLRSSPR